MEALFKARAEGLCRHVGVTGHGLRIAAMHLRSLAEAPFASVLFPWSHSLAEVAPYAADVAMLHELCHVNGVARQTIKAVARRRWDDPHQPHFSWYEPVDDADALKRCVEFVLAYPRMFLNTSSDARLLRPILQAATAHDGTMPTPATLERDRAEHGITPIFDGEALEVI